MHETMHNRTMQFWIRATICACVALLLFLVPHYSRAEMIDSFVSDIEVRKDATFTVHEKIVYLFDAPKHGMFRCIPTKHQDPASSLLKDRYLDISIESVTANGQSAPYTTDTGGDQLCIKIGDPEKTVTGSHTYDITYTVAGSITYEEYGGAELYWNVTGDEWTIPIRYAEARVSSPDSILLPQRSCYRGEKGKTASCEMSTTEAGVVIFNARYFDPTEGLTIAQALDRAKIALDVRERYKPFLVWGIVALISLVTCLFFVYRYKSKYKTGKPIIAQYEPYPGVKPMYTGVLMDGKLDPRDITAGIVYLAEQGYITIQKTTEKALFFIEVDDYVISLKKVPDAETYHFERSVLELLFDSPLTEGKVTSLKELRTDWEKQRLNVQKNSELRTSLEKDLEAQGFLQVQFTILQYIVGIIIYWFVATFVVGALAGFGIITESVLVPFYIVSVILFVSASLMRKRRTAKGNEALDHLKGFKEYLSVTEAQRYIFHNAPEHNAEQFMKYLPYAIAFGVEKQWAKLFEKITIPNPNWYDGGTSGSFSAPTLTHSIGAFSSFLTRSTASASDGSASSGGGFSGGGSGGGGGGSW